MASERHNANNTFESRQMIIIIWIILNPSATISSSPLCHSHSLISYVYHHTTIISNIRLLCQQRKETLNRLQTTNISKHHTESIMRYEENCKKFSKENVHLPSLLDIQTINGKLNYTISFFCTYVYSFVLVLLSLASLRHLAMVFKYTSATRQLFHKLYFIFLFFLFLFWSLFLPLLLIIVIFLLFFSFSVFNTYLINIFLQFIQLFLTFCWEEDTKLLLNYWLLL